MSDNANINSMTTASISSLADVGAGYMGYSGKKLEGQYAKDRAEENAASLEKQAEGEINRGAEDARALKQKVRAIVGDQRVVMANQGIDMNSGSAKALRDQTEAFGALDALTIENNAYKKAYGLRTDAVNMRAEGERIQNSKNAEGFQTLVTGGLKAFQNYEKAFPKSKTKKEE